MPWGSWINDLPTELFLVVHIAAFALGAGFAWLAFERELALRVVGLVAAQPFSGGHSPPRPAYNRKDSEMNTRTHRTIPLALTMLVALFSALVALAVAGGHDAAAHSNSGEHATTHAAVADNANKKMSRSEFILRQEMRRLWEDHITWTRLAIISLTTDSPDTEATVGRLLQNQTDIGDAVKPFYGEAAGNELTRQLRLHILIAADVVAAARAGDEEALAEALTRWRSNADDIAAVLNSVNPKYWELATMEAEMSRHLDLTTQEAVARIQGNWSADVAAYDDIHEHILHMSDLLSTGLVEQFPNRFR